MYDLNKSEIMELFDFDLPPFAFDLPLLFDVDIDFDSDIET